MLCEELRGAGFEPFEPTGGYFVWVKSKDGRMTGRSGKGMTLDPPDQFKDYMRLCFAWLTDEQIVEGVKFLKINQLTCNRYIRFIYRDSSRRKGVSCSIIYKVYIYSTIHLL